jgi:hypothetical protein
MREEGHGEQGGPVTFDAAFSYYPSLTHAGDRWDDLTGRDLNARARAVLVARGEYDPAVHGTGKPEPLTVPEHLQVLAIGEMLARHYRHPVYVDRAVKAGATWDQVARATGQTEAEARAAYRTWADGQHRLWHMYAASFGMDDAEHAATMKLAGCEPEAGQ